MMPKSTATSLPSASTNRLPGCMSAWKKPSRSAWRRKVWITARGELLQVEALAPRARARSLQRRAVDPFQRQHVLGGAVPVDRRARGNPDRPWCSPPSRTAPRLRAADPSRSRPSGAACRRSRSGAAAAPRRKGSRPVRAAKVKASRSTRKRRSMPGRSTFTATGLRPSGVVDLGAMHLRDRGGRDRRAERCVDLVERLAERRRRPRPRPRPAETAASCPAASRGRARAPCRPRRAASPGTGRASRRSGRAASARSTSRCSALPAGSAARSAARA